MKKYIFATFPLLWTFSALSNNKKVNFMVKTFIPIKEEAQWNILSSQYPFAIEWTEEKSHYSNKVNGTKYLYFKYCWG